MDSRIRRFLSKSKTLETIKTFLMYELCPTRHYHLTYSGKFERLYSDHDKFFGKYFVRCYFPRENICIIMSFEDSTTFPVVSTILKGQFCEKKINTLIYHPEIKTICCGPTIVILQTHTESIILDTGLSLKATLLKVKY